MKKNNTGRYDYQTPERLLCRKEKIKPKGGSGLLKHKYGKKEEDMLNKNGHETDNDQENGALFKNQSFNQMHNQVNQYVRKNMEKERNSRHAVHDTSDHDEGKNHGMMGCNQA
jgi:hypothetical protein